MSSWKRLAEDIKREFQSQGEEEEEEEGHSKPVPGVDGLLGRKDYIYLTRPWRAKMMQ